MPWRASAELSMLFNVVSTSLTFLIIVHSSYVFTTYMSLIASTIVTGSSIRTATVIGAVDKARSTAIGILKVLPLTSVIMQCLQYLEKALVKDAQSCYFFSGRDSDGGGNEAKRERMVLKVREVVLMSQKLKESEITASVVGGTGKLSQLLIFFIF
ncbi:MAG: hypothetical protein MTP17_00145 [Candidatus Midichloria sp.]|nr:MAG: hypothetical protein MTP17_00145 [Candidatus Midichloria sp.]